MAKYRKKPVVIEAIQLTEENILEVYRFINGENSVNLPSRLAEQRWDEYEWDLVQAGGMRLKTPESDGETQKASFGDYVVKGHSEALGEHCWPVKPDYFEKNYELVIE